MTIGNQAARYPDFRPEDIQRPNELTRKLNELTRAIDDKDKRGINPYDVYGRSITINETNLTYEGPNGGFEEYSYSVPRDVGTVFVNFPTTYTNEVVRIYLSESSSVEGRTVAIVVQSPTSGSNPTNYATVLQVAQGSDNVFSTSTTAVAINSHIQVRAYFNKWLIIAKD